MGTQKDVLKLIENWNCEEFEIHGRVTEIDIVRYYNKTVQTFGRIPLIDRYIFHTPRKICAPLARPDKLGGHDFRFCEGS